MDSKFKVGDKVIIISSSLSYKDMPYMITKVKKYFKTNDGYIDEEFLTEDNKISEISIGDCIEYKYSNRLYKRNIVNGISFWYTIDIKDDTYYYHERIFRLCRKSRIDNLLSNM